MRLLANHPNFGITLMTADRKAGQSIGTVFPHLIAQVWPYSSLVEIVLVSDCIVDANAIFFNMIT